MWDMSTPDLIYYSLAAVLSITVLVGISRMSKVDTAVSGNILGSCCMLLAIVLTLWYFDIFNVIQLWVAMLIGALIGMRMAKRVLMIQMPQMVGLLNGFGGLASMIAGILTLVGPDAMQANKFTLVTATLAIVVGGLTWSGSAVAAAKLHNVISSLPVVFKHHQLLSVVPLFISCLACILIALPGFHNERAFLVLIIIAAAAANIFGYVFAIRVGGADMPVTISLLNSLSGVAGAIAGMAISDLLLVSIGGIVGASGLLLTQIMCRSMNRRLSDILLGKTSMPQSQKQTAAPAAPKAELPPEIQAARWLKDARQVIIVPGHGMAVSQTQALAKQLADTLEAEGKRVDFAIHPGAGRMPGHMNVLLAEVNVPYDKLRALEDINPRFKDTDAVVVIGANDVINPAAKEAGSLLYGLPILEVGQAKHVLILNLDLSPGYAGVDNPLYDKARVDNQQVLCLLGDAKENLNKLLASYRGAEAPLPTVPSASPAPDLNTPAQWLRQAERVIIVPGYGMALSQAQPLVKQLADALEAEGKQVDFAIHPVAGRMPGHMNVLLAEVNVPYDKLREMQDINPQFRDTDAVIVIGANDVVNPAANSAEGTPIYGMPVLDIGDARHVIILNYDLQPGYAGVDNPLYAEAEHSQEHVQMMLGDAKDSLNKLLAEYHQADGPSAAAPAPDLNTPAQWLRQAERVIIVPGYGMALSQAQPLVKQLADALEAEGKQVDFAIHPVAGRMPGHMNVLLAEVNVPYDKLREMQDINPQFRDTDAVIVIGANDVVNPAANSAEGTPIYGMPVLDIGDARHVIILNYDLQPGYAGVDNPLYAEAEHSQEHVQMMLGDAKDSLNKLLAEYHQAG